MGLMDLLFGKRPPKPRKVRTPAANVTARRSTRKRRTSAGRTTTTRRIKGLNIRVGWR